MKDPKSLYLLILALIVVTISFVLISIRGYRFYFQKPVSGIAVQKDLLQNPPSLLKSADTNRLNGLGRMGKNDSLSQIPDSVLQQKLAEIDKLTSDIRKILNERTLSGETVEATAQIAELKQSVDDLRSQNYEVQRENARLNKMMEELLADKPVNKKRDDLKAGNSTTTSGYAPSIPLLVAHLRFTAFTASQTPTSLASKTIYLNGSFLVNIKSGNSSPHIYIVIIQPDGSTLLDDSSKLHRFKTGSGAKEYSVAIPFNSETDNQKRLHFSIHLPICKKGEYKMHIYHQGILIGKMNRKLY